MEIMTFICQSHEMGFYVGSEMVCNFYHFVETKAVPDNLFIQCNIIATHILFILYQNWPKIYSLEHAWVTRCTSKLTKEFPYDTPIC